METRRLLIAALLSMAVLLLWQKFFPAPAPVAAPPAAAPRAAEGGPPAREPSTAAAAESPPPAASAAAAASETPSTAASEPAVEATVEERVVLETDFARAEWSNRGAQLMSFQLKRHQAEDNGPVDLVRRRQGGAYPFGLIARDGSSSALNDVLFAVERRQDGVTFSYRGAAGWARKTVRVDDDGLLDIAVEASGDWQLLLGPGLRNPGANEETRFSHRSAAYAKGQDLERIDVAKSKEPSLIEASDLSWVALQDQYFLTAVLAPQGMLEFVVEPMLFELDAAGLAAFRPRPAELAEGDEELGSELRLLLAPEEQSLSFKAYFGSKQFERLKALPGGLERTVDLGVFGIIARPLLLALRWIHDHVVANYGWAIILLTVLLRILLFPLNHKSITSMQKMQTLNPKMQAIRAKYRGKLKDKKGRPNSEASAKMNQEIMALYKEEGVNPAAGCLPMLLQMPVLFAFYRLLSAAVELRHSEWLWISDLSARDPIYVLPIVMGISMFVQQKMTPSQTDPMQRRLFMLMPIVFTGLFLGFPAGMVLYWLTNNVLAIAQQYGYKRWQAAQAVADGGSSQS